MDWILELLKDESTFRFALVVGGILSVRELSKMRKSVENLNIGMAVMVERLGGHEKRIRILERKK